jgi:protease PrsW
MLGILSAGIAPGLALLCYFYLKDQFGVEPITLVIKTFFFGSLLVFPIMFIQYVLDTESIISSSIGDAFISTSLLEEFFKWFLVYYTAVLHSHFDEPYDGIVYGASVSLGFATTENILYLVGNGLEFAIGRALLPVSSHAMFGVIMGYYLGKAKFSSHSKRKWLLLSFLVPFFLHGLYDYILYLQSTWIYVMLPFMIFLWWLGLRKVKKAHSLSAQYSEVTKTLHS